MKRANKKFIFFTVPIALLMIISSGIGIFYPDLYSRNTTDMISQTIGQDISNLIVVVPALILSSWFASKGSVASNIIWFGVMITNVYSFVIYAFALHFNFLFHVYCAILGLSIFSILVLFKSNLQTGFNSWYTDKVAVRKVGVFLIVIASLFTLLWLSDSLPAVLTNSVPDSILKAGLLTNPIHALDFSFYLPLMFLSAILLLKKQALGFFLAPVMLVFAIMTSINIVSLMLVSMWFIPSNTWPMISSLFVLALISLFFLFPILKCIKK